jgi:CRP/FNR family cyclic AMP-dependent transcriptional regulator
MHKPFLDSLLSADRAALQAIGAVRRFRPTATVLLQGDQGDQVIVIGEGRVRILSTTPDGRDVLLAVRGRGELIGELNMLAEGPGLRAATVIAIDEVTARVIAADEFLAFLEHHPRVALMLLRQSAERLRESSTRHGDAGAYDTLHRVARTLIALSERDAREVTAGVVVFDGLTQNDLAGLVVSSREAVAKALHVLREKGLVTTARRSILVRDLDSLRRFTS